MTKQYLHHVILTLCSLGAGSMLFAQSMVTTTPSSETSGHAYPWITVEIWSDVVCPFCYIGKRQFEAALAQYPGRDKVEVIWRSFQLDPDLQTDPLKNPIRSLAERKGWSEEYTRQVVNYVSNMAREVGLEYHLDKSVVANTFDAHRLIHLGRHYGKQTEVKERLLAAHFIEGRNIADPVVLAGIGTTAGLPTEAVKAVLESNTYADAVREDIALAQRFAITDLPFFLFNRNRAISGAQGTAAFLRMLTELGQLVERGN